MPVLATAALATASVLTAGLGGTALVSTLSKDHGVPERAAVAYLAAAHGAPCPLDYRFVTAMGGVESGHGTHDKTHLNAEGKEVDDTTNQPKPAVSSQGAVGPMQFTPDTWATYASDGDGDGVADINDIDDATVAAVKLLCSDGAANDIEQAVCQYNGGGNCRQYAESRDYVAQVDERVAALPADDGSATPAAGQQVKLPSDKGRICGVAEATSPDNDCLDLARQRASYLWALLGQILGKGDTPKLHNLWSKLNGAPPATATAQNISATMPSTAKASKVVDVAESWVGKQFNPGETAQCAYWVREALKEAGLNVGVTKQALDGYAAYEGTANGWGPDQGQVIHDPGQIQPGDIVMFGGTYGGYPATDITHVGIAIGGGQLIHRPTSEAPVKQSAISDYAHFIGAVRLSVLK